MARAIKSALIGLICAALVSQVVAAAAEGCRHRQRHVTPGSARVQESRQSLPPASDRARCARHRRRRRRARLKVSLRPRVVTADPRVKCFPARSFAPEFN